MAHMKYLKNNKVKLSIGSSDDLDSVSFISILQNCKDRIKIVSFPAFQVFFHPVWNTSIRLTKRQWNTLKLVLLAILVVWNIGGFAAGYYVCRYILPVLLKLAHSSPAGAFILISLIVIVYLSLYLGTAALILSLCYGYVMRENLEFNQHRLIIYKTICGIGMKKNIYQLNQIKNMRQISNPSNTQGYFQFEYNGEIVAFGIGDHAETADAAVQLLNTIMMQHLAAEA